MDLNKVKIDFEKNGYTKIQIIDKKKINFFKNVWEILLARSYLISIKIITIFVKII